MISRGVSSQPAIASPKARKDHPFGSRDRTRKIAKIQNGTAELYEIYAEQ